METRHDATPGYYPQSNLPSNRSEASEVQQSSYTLKSYVPHIILGVIAVVAILALAAMAYAPGTETAFIQNTLGVIAVGATTGLAGIIKGPGT